MKISKLTSYSVLLLLGLAISYTLFSQLNPGVARWPIKTSIPKDAAKKTVKDLNVLLTLPNPPGVKQKDKAYDDKRIPKFDAPRGLKEGDLVTTYGYVHLVALEDDHKNHRDGDYHIQITTSPVWGDSCLVVEVPLDDERFVSDPKLRKRLGLLREKIRNKLLRGNEASTRGNVMEHPPYMKITGQLFFDNEHVTGVLRGKNPNKSKVPKMKSYTPWELHPVISMEFVK